jgi:hypothetical protein
MTSSRPADSPLCAVELVLSPNEGSGLLPVAAAGLRAAHGWDRAFWVCFDEGPVEQCVAVVGHRRGEPPTGGWEIERLVARQATAVPMKTEDCEALAYHDGWVYVVGSHFGSKKGPLQPKRAFLARFREDGVHHVRDGEATVIEVSRPGFLLHRLVNDALLASGIPVVPLHPNLRAAFVTATRDRGVTRQKSWAGQVRETDFPLNIEGATFLPDGTLLLGLRFPVTADGRPLLVHLEGVPRLFETGPGAARPPRVIGCSWLELPTETGVLAGIRDLTTVDGTLHAITGGLDATGKESVVLASYPGGHDSDCVHWSCPLPAPGEAGPLAPVAVRRFLGHPRIEGIAADQAGHFYYVSDEDDAVYLCHTA